MERLSALMDGELEREEAARLIPQVKEREDLRRAWATYHLIGEALRCQGCQDVAVAGSVSAKLAKEPTVLAPRRTASEFGRRWALPSLAAAAAVATVTWMGLETQQGSSSPVAMPASHMLVPTVVVQPINGLSEFTQAAHLPTSFPAPPQVQIQIPAREFDAYLMAHQEFSPSTIIQGLAPYVRTVTFDAVETGQ